MHLKKQISPVLAIGIILVLSIFAYLFLTYAIDRHVAQSRYGGSDQLIAPAPEAAKGSDMIEVKKFSNESQTAAQTGTKYEVVHEYVQLKLLETDTTQQKNIKKDINIKIESDTRARYQKSLSDMKEAAQVFNDMPTESRIERHLVSEADVKEAMTYFNAQTNVFSYVIYAYEDAGGAHGSGGFASKTYDLSTGKELGIADFVNKDTYKTVLGAMVVDQIKNQASTCLRCEYLSEIDVTEWDDYVTYQNYALAPNGMTLLFGAYELGPYAATSAGQEIFISKSELADLIVRQW